MTNPTPELSQLTADLLSQYSPVLGEVSLEIDGHTYTVFAADKAEGERVIRDHIALIQDSTLATE